MKLGMVQPDRYAFLRTEHREPLPLENIVIGMADQRTRETTALLAVLAELLVDDDALRERCRRELSMRTDDLPRWIVELRHVDIYRAVRRTDVLGDGDEIAIGARLAGGREITVATYVEHDEFSSVQTIYVLDDPIDQAVAAASEHVDPDTSYVDVSLADARAWIEQGLVHAGFEPHPDGWLESLPILRWLLAQMPEGGEGREGFDLDDATTSELMDDFFADPAGAPFADADYRDLLHRLLDSGSGDPRRWSAARIERVLASSDAGEHTPLEIALDAPAVLRAFVPFVHAQSGIRGDLTDRALAVVDDMARHYKQNLLRATAPEYGDDDWQPPPWSSPRAS